MIMYFPENKHVDHIVNHRLPTWNHLPLRTHYERHGVFSSHDQVRIQADLICLVATDE